MNTLYVIAPYRYEGFWAFDDPKRGLELEPFVGGADTIIDHWVASIPDADDGFRMVFSAEPFPDYNLHLVWQREEMNGNIYLAEEYGLEGWLCSALLKYFDRAPRDIYAKCESASKHR